jgi:GntR family transcriptional regulator of arabinose operon
MSDRPHLCRNGSEPLYLQVVSYLKDRISDGTFSPASTLPSEKDLTSLLGVSRPTVRHALKILIEEGLVERVPGRGSFVTGAQTLPLRARTGNLALIGPEMRDSFLMHLVTGAEYVASQNDYHLILCNAGNQISIEQKHLRDLWAGEKVDGFVIMLADAPQPHRTLRELVQADVPIILIDRYFKDLAKPFVVSDNRQGAYQAVRHLIELGHSRIGFVTRPNLYVSSVAQRLEGYKRALDEAGLEYDSSLVFQGLLPYLSEVQVLEKPSPRLAEYDREAIRGFLSRKDRPSAVLVCNDIIAVQVLEVCREMEVRIPQDMAVVGFDDDTVAPLVTPPLTTVRQQRHEMGARAVSMLLDVLNGKPVEQQVFLPVELVVRESCGADLS